MRLIAAILYIGVSSTSIHAQHHQPTSNSNFNGINNGIASPTNRNSNVDIEGVAVITNEADVTAAASVKDVMKEKLGLFTQKTSFLRRKLTDNHQKVAWSWSWFSTPPPEEVEQSTQEENEEVEWYELQTTPNEESNVALIDTSNQDTTGKIGGTIQRWNNGLSKTKESSHHSSRSRPSPTDFGGKSYATSMSYELLEIEEAPTQEEEEWYKFPTTPNEESNKALTDIDISNQEHKNNELVMEAEDEITASHDDDSSSSKSAEAKAAKVSKSVSLYFIPCYVICAFFSFLFSNRFH